jgi:hypothetical protein
VREPDPRPDVDLSRLPKPTDAVIDQVPLVS